MNGSAEKAEEVVEKEEGNYDEDGGHYDGDGGMRGRKPGKPDSQEIFTETERPIAERLGRHVGSGAGAGFCAVGG